MREDVVQLPTGAWYDPAPDRQHGVLCVHGNPNILVRDLGTSSLGQGCAGQISTVQIERFDAPLPPIRAFDPPLI
ncbi:Trimethylamine-N-oxide reductase 1 [bioreactor metagenome]|uniref:Trimethylamine-N-oxide reductase 1 n=1 Tax=bioreactor metagenome TaxID=1076179 RepID=A0A645GSS6_9ZZZZ